MHCDLLGLWLPAAVSAISAPFAFSSGPIIALGHTCMSYLMSNYYGPDMELRA